ncbi:hypothetical protein EJ05DRAFT_240501 [Pseudovirgaria hyperparasitica]|uniref:SprT-like domain-containing protein n=1 Tax=Pseudovirgaria hyperparasitica TaxID=470096 RepID=A0A6A6WEX3_9PEZI|nr:uncharacterized protein EJ05DRAFT_240501 [Pseudovirgaria hyperparasitica]KAF2760709.1 hypothetical protein EJ05DRAFT_240501 [Pseudovirgaria hyperparasitica]
MARLRKVIECSSDSDDSLPDLHTLLAVTRIKPQAKNSPSQTSSTSNTHQQQKSPQKLCISSTSSLSEDFSALKVKVPSKLEQRKVSPKDGQVSTVHSPRKQRALKPLNHDHTLLNRLSPVELASKKEKEVSTSRGSQVRKIRKEAILQSSAKKPESRACKSDPKEISVVEEPVKDVGSDSDSDAPVRRRARNSPVKVGTREPPKEHDDTPDDFEFEQTEVEVEETIMCGSDMDEDSFIVHTDSSEDECEDRKVVERPLFRPAKSNKKSLKDISIKDELPARSLYQPPASIRSTVRPGSSSDNNAGAILTFSPPRTRSPRKAPPQEPPTTPPSHSPVRRLVSPKKQRPRIPTPPHGSPSVEGFWDPQLVNEWHDKYSPQKPLVSPHKSLKHRFGTNATSSSPDLIEPPSPTSSPRKRSPQKKTLADSRKEFESRKTELAKSFVEELDHKITQDRLRELTASAGGIKIIWSTKLATTAGRANWRREVFRIRGPSTTSTNGTTTCSTLTTKTLHHASIELSTKVIDCNTRLYNVLAHEFCHLANFMISQVTARPHGAEFKAWASKVSSAFSHLDVVVTTKHTYEIAYKYIWACVGCATEYKRHSKSVDPERHACSVCKGRLVQIQPVPRAGKGPGGERGISEYQRFVKDHFKTVQGECKGLSHGVVMERLGRMYREQKKKEGEEDGRRGVGREKDDELEKVLGGLSLG